ncbi:MAG TPA: hypothetical protein DCX80_12565 [Chloroflexi bacterium]|jgi:hypothetical protein|nr:hypothetical protein [Chloroflexota bacterium]
MSDERSRQIAALAERFRDYLTHQTDTDILEIEAVATDHGLCITAFDRLDVALELLLDMASVYSDAGPARGALEPLILPAAALAGEYLRAAGLASWHEPGEDDLAIEALVIVSGATAIDLDGVARAALASGRPSLSAVARRLADLDH